jgi:hypothetical protein
VTLDQKIASSSHVGLDTVFTRDGPGLSGLDYRPTVCGPVIRGD